MKLTYSVIYVYEETQELCIVLNLLDLLKEEPPIILYDCWYQVLES